MTKPAFHVLFALVLAALALATTLTLSAPAEQAMLVQMPDGTVIETTQPPPDGKVLGPAPQEAPPTPPLEQTPEQLPSTPAPTQPTPSPQPQTPPAATPDPGQPAAPTPAQPSAPSAPREVAREEQKAGGDRRPAKSKRRKAKPRRKVKPHTKEHDRKTGGARPAPLRQPDGAPTRSNPGFVDALPGPAFAQGVPNFVIRKFRVPVFLLPIYQAAGIQYGVRWEILAAINEIETDYGRNLNVSSAGALGWMQFIPSSWRMYGTDANKDGKKDPYNPVDAIFAAGRYLKAAGYEQSVRRAIFAYNHADWYVDSVMLRARLIAGVPADLVGSLTGLTEGRFPVAARARYADDLSERDTKKKVRKGENAANVIESKDDRRSVDIFAKEGSPVVATNDGEIKKVGTDPELGRYVVLQDVYGNRYRYSGLGSVSRFYPVPKEEVAANPSNAAKAIKANRDKDHRPSGPASSGRQPEKDVESHDADTPAGVNQPAAVKERLFANPNLPGARENGGYEQALDAEAAKGNLDEYNGAYAEPLRFDPRRYRLRALRKGARVIGGTVLGRVGQVEPETAPHMEFSIRPAGRGAPRIDPKPILDGWKLLEATAIYRAAGRNALRAGDGSISIGQILLLPKALLEKRVLSDERIDVYRCGRDDIRSGAVDRRVLATLAFLAESGLRPSVTSLKCGHGFYTSSGNVSHHSSGNAVDIAKINGVPILGHQESGGVTDQAVRRLMRLQGTVQPDQIISLLDYGANTVAMGDHGDHIHVGFRPRFGDNRKLAKQARAVLRPGQWSDLLAQLRKIENPTVPTDISKYAIPARPKDD